MPMSASEIGSNFQSDGFTKAGGSGGPGAVGGQFNVKEATQVSSTTQFAYSEPEYLKKVQAKKIREIK